MFAIITPSFFFSEKEQRLRWTADISKNPVSFFLLFLNKKIFSISILTWTLLEESCCYSNWSVIFCGQEDSRQELELLQDFHEALRMSLFQMSWAFLSLVCMVCPRTLPTPIPQPSHIGLAQQWSWSIGTGHSGSKERSESIHSTCCVTNSELMKGDHRQCPLV